MGFLAPDSGNGASQLLTALIRNHPGSIWVISGKGLCCEARLLRAHSDLAEHCHCDFHKELPMLNGLAIKRETEVILSPEVWDQILKKTPSCRSIHWNIPPCMLLVSCRIPASSGVCGTQQQGRKAGNWISLAVSLFAFRWIQFVHIFIMGRIAYTLVRMSKTQTQLKTFPLVLCPFHAITLQPIRKPIKKYVKIPHVHLIL